ncbi:MAG: VanZ family protein [Streptococcaceae bacterium]|jgi:glycopeptide antibiotics resistance protein|nr:VanZ family protein [Streptococcaceae bacterium]
MKELMLPAYELLTELVPFFLVLMLILRFHPKHSQTKNLKVRKNVILLIVFALYICAVLNVTGPGTIFDLKYFDFGRQAINFSPFPEGIDFSEHFLNIVLFVPLGVLLGLFWTKKGYLLYTFMYGLGFSLLIECSQLLNHRAADIDDLILNTLGAVVGYLVICVFLGKSTAKEKSKFVILVPALFILVIIAGRFFLYNEMAFAKILYGF